MSANLTPSKDSIYQLKITLREIRPPIWRRIQVPGTITFHELHLIIQRAMGWWNEHLHQYIINNVYYLEPDPDTSPEDIDERKAVLAQVVRREKAKFLYEYDFGDDWLHDILVEKLMNPEPGKQYPICCAGKRACPPEDCGGPWGYYNLLEAVGDPSHPEHEELLEWVGGEYDPEAFDLNEVNEELKPFRKRKKKQ